MAKPSLNTREQVLRAALKRFADAGYAATSVQDIVDDAKVSKPALYYHFTDKAGLFQALVNQAHDERYQVMQKAIAGGKTFPEKAEAMLMAVFGYFRQNRELMRLALSTMLAAPGEVPENFSCQAKCERIFELIHGLMQQGQKSGELDKRFDSRELAFGFYGLANFYLVAHLVCPDCEPDDLTARKIVELFLAGAAAKGSGRKK